MTLRQLRYFIAVAEEHSITQAANRLFISQPGLSATIRELESELGTALFVRDRNANRLVLTEAGEIFLKYASSGLACIDHGRDAVSTYMVRDKQILRIGYIHTIPSLQQMVQDYTARQKESSTEISRRISTSNQELLALLQANKLNFAFCLSLQKGIEGLRIFRQKLYIMVSRTHPWGDLTEISFDDLKNVPCVRVQHAKEINQQIDEVYRIYHTHPMILSAEVGNLNAALTYVLDYNCYTVTPKFSTIDQTRLNALTIIGHPLRRDIYLAWKSGRKFTANEQAFLDYANSLLTDQPPEIG